MAHVLLDVLARQALTTLGLLPDRAIARLSELFFSRSAAQFEAACADPRRVQLERLFDILKRAEKTAFGVAHGFREIRDLEDFRRRVPVQGWEAFEPFVARMIRGEANVLVPDRPRMFARSSGTTGTPKHVPVTTPFLDEYAMPRRMFALHVVRAFPGLIRGKFLSVHSPRVEGRTADGTPIGSITLAFGAAEGTDQGVEVETAPAPFEVAPKTLFLVEDYALRYRALLRLALQERVTLATAVNPSTLVLIAHKLDEHADALARDLRAGTFEGLDQLPEPAESDVRRALRRSPRAAERLERARKERGRVLPTDAWPEMLGLLCWKGGSAPFWLAKLADLYPGRPAMDYGYLATEGGFSLPMSPDGASGVVVARGHFLEFFPEDDLARGRTDRARLADELEVGARYRVVVTASNGLYRYDINDVVECTGYHRKTAEIAFVHKGGNMSSLTGEKLGERHVVEAAARAEAETGVRLSGLCLAPELIDPPRYVVALEPLAGRLEGGEGARFLGAFEASLRSVNVEYAAKRDSLRLGAPALRVLPRGAFARDRERRVKNGAPDSHVKPLHLVKNVAALAELEGGA